NENFVLTAAHCINQSKEIQVLNILKILVINVFSRSESMHTVDKIYVHSKFIAETYDNDIALLKLKEPIRFSEYVIPACLPKADFANEVLMTQKSGRVSGFGREYDGGQLPKKLKVLELPYVNRNTCVQSTYFVVTENMFCAGYDTEEKDACQGDSGGPHLPQSPAERAAGDAQCARRMGMAGHRGTMWLLPTVLLFLQMRQTGTVFASPWLCAALPNPCRELSMFLLCGAGDRSEHPVALPSHPPWFPLPAAG
uniref:Vitamin K-dependent protein C n=1 Tax=Zonotrichia albicollis TaxID=44394 RepID=A0A8D2QEN2_ZONAL